MGGKLAIVISGYNVCFLQTWKQSRCHADLACDRCDQRGNNMDVMRPYKQNNTILTLLTITMILVIAHILLIIHIIIIHNDSSNNINNNNDTNDSDNTKYSSDNDGNNSSNAMRQGQPTRKDVYLCIGCLSSSRLL